MNWHELAVSLMLIIFVCTETASNQYIKNKSFKGSERNATHYNAVDRQNTKKIKFLKKIHVYIFKGSHSYAWKVHELTFFFFHENYNRYIIVFLVPRSYTQTKKKKWLVSSKKNLVDFKGRWFDTGIVSFVVFTFSLSLYYTIMPGF